QSSSRLLPHLGGDLRYDENQTSVSSNTSERSRANGFFYNLGADQPVFHWGELRNGLAQKKVQVAIAEQNYAEAWRLFVNDVRRGYLALIIEKSQLRAQRYALGLVKQ